MCNKVPGGISRACRVLNLSRSVFYYQSQREDGAVMEALEKKVKAHPTEGFWKAYRRLRNEGYEWNHKRVHRVYCLMKLNIRKKSKKEITGKGKNTIDNSGKEKPHMVDGFHARCVGEWQKNKSVQHHG